MTVFCLSERTYDCIGIPMVSISKLIHENIRISWFVFLLEIWRERTVKSVLDAFVKVLIFFSLEILIRKKIFPMMTFVLSLHFAYSNDSLNCFLRSHYSFKEPLISEICLGCFL